MKCNRHEWDTEDKEWCWKCEEITLNQIKKSYETNLNNNSSEQFGEDKLEKNELY
jgi:hypothetical protein